jgi:hypothetical protein
MKVGTFSTIFVLGGAMLQIVKTPPNPYVRCQADKW